MKAFYKIVQGTSKYEVSYFKSKTYITRVYFESLHSAKKDCKKRGIKLSKKGERK